MSCVPTGRVGLTPDVSGFVVHEDQALAARALRAARKAQVQAGEGAEVARRRLSAGVAGSRTRVARLLKWPWTRGGGGASPEDLGTDGQATAPAPRSARRQALELRLRRARITVAAAIIRGHQLAIIALERLRPADRGRDLGMILWLALRWMGGAAWRAPRWLQVPALLGLGLWLAPWPAGEAAGEPNTVIAMSATPVEKPREPEIWRPVPGVIAAWHLEAPELDRSAMKYRARRQTGGARQDMLSWFEEPTDDGGRPRNRLSGALAVEYYPKEQPAAESLFVDAARRTALVGASIEKMSDAYRINNKFGAIEIADATLAGSTGNRSCLVFRHVAESVPLQLHGWYCSAPQRPLDRATLSCLLDRFDLIGGSDASVRAWFAKVERSRRACGAYPVSAAPAGWVDANGRVPDLKTAIPDSRKM